MDMDGEHLAAGSDVTIQSPPKRWPLRPGGGQRQCSMKAIRVWPLKEQLTRERRRGLSRVET
jgi:hypothetical protein